MDEIITVFNSIHNNSKLLNVGFHTSLDVFHILMVIFLFYFVECLKIGERKLTTLEIKNKLRDCMVYGGDPYVFIKHIYLSILFHLLLFQERIKIQPWSLFLIFKLKI